MPRRFPLRAFRPSAAALALALAACATSPLGRQQLVFYPEDEMAQLGEQAFTKMQRQTPRVRSGAQRAFVECVARHVTQAVQAPGAPRSWEVVVFEDDSANAFALPGGKIGVHTGMLRIADEQGPLAAVIAHEVAHVIADHPNERLSTSSLAQAGLSAAAEVLAGSETPAQKELLGLLGLGAQVGVLLPFSRTQETEADLLGLEIMARAGFDPRAAVTLWQNMEALGGASPPGFLSTHPSGRSRIQRLQQRMPEVLPIHRRAREAGRRPDCG